MFENKLGNTVSQIKDDVINLINLKLAYYELILTKRIIKCVSALIKTNNKKNVIKYLMG